MRMKKVWIVSFLLCMLTACAVMLTACGDDKLEAGNEETVDGVVYTLLEDGTWEVSGYDETLGASVTIPGEVKGRKVSAIGRRAFYGCDGLTSVTLTEGIRTIGEQAFRNCGDLQAIKWPGTVNAIGDAAFRGCSSLVSIAIPDSVKHLGERLFYGCESLTDVTLPAGLESIGYRAFYRCDILESIHYAGSVSQWNALTKDDNWISNRIACQVVCTDGTVSVNED